jgi:hypothetical protein
MKTQISYRKLDGGDGVALINGSISDLSQAKRELANWLELPATDVAGRSGWPPSQGQYRARLGSVQSHQRVARFSPIQEQRKNSDIIIALAPRL